MNKLGVLLVVAIIPPGLRPAAGGREVWSTTATRGLESLVFLLSTSVGLPHGFSQT